MTCCRPFLRRGALLLILGLPALGRAQESRSAGQFDLVVRKSAFLRTGATHLETTSAFATYTGEFGSMGKALKIQMFADTLARRGSATLVLFVDQQQRITQANLTYVVPGTTVTRTIASTPDEIAKYFPRYRYTNGRVRLTSRGEYSQDSADESFTLSWRVEVDAPVIVRP